MVVWVKRLAMILAAGAFFITFAVSIDCTGMYDLSGLSRALIKGAFAFCLLWFAGFIIGDILLKGIVSDIPFDKSNLLEGGLLQHIFIRQAKDSPGETELHFTEVVDRDDKVVKKEKKRKDAREK